MSNLVEQIMQQVAGNALGQMTQQVGAQPNQMESAISAALPLLVNALARNTKEPSGAEALAGALDRDHDGSILDNLGGFLGNAQEGPGAGILRHVLGERQPVIENALSQNSGLSTQATSQMLKMLAPIVLGYLGRKKRQENLNQSGLAEVLMGAQNQQQQQNPQGMGMLGKLLDADGDGDIKDDLMRLGGNLLGNMFKR